MKKKSPSLVSPLLLAAILTLSSIAQADENSQNTEYPYGEKVGSKALNGITNMTTAVLEIPKNIINTTNNSNIIYGVTGGLFKGIIHMLGRLSTGLVDVITMPIPTYPISEPAYIWDDFDTDTSYKPLFRLDTTVRKKETNE
ncbi:MAG: exosortase system-associated protein, TIGR04073 family [Methylococcales bacterium]|nr:exosortase system-associated protein, TIGR04073 family [Methylococcales bacterium]